METTTSYWLYALGFFAQSLFGARLIVQLFHTERAGKVMSPTLFWQLSLIASFLFLIYGILRNDVVIIVGQTLSYYIYVRNLQLKNYWNDIHVIPRWILAVLPIVTLTCIFLLNTGKIQRLVYANDFTHPILVMGAIGQLMLNVRFIYQWYYSEKYKTSILPLGFWIISTIASVMILVYASYRIDPVLLVAQGMGIFVYVRNIIVHFKEKRAA
jgi:lipid-A-disaccharide synthase-like uncharacterized protein